MTTPAPDLAEKSLRRVLAIAQGDGWSIIIVAGLSGLISLATGGWLATGTALLVVLAGAGELHGRRQLLRRDPRGVNWLVGAQLFLLAVIWVYAFCRWRYFDPVAVWAELPSPVQAEIDRQLVVAGGEPEFDRPLLLAMMNLIVCAVLALVTLFYQGGLALYYALRRDRVRQALSAQPPPVTSPVL